MSHERTDDLPGRMTRGEQDVADALFRVYTPYLRAVVRRQLSDRLRSRFDSSDVVQSVWVQVVRHLNREGWPVHSEAELRGLLATIARRRLITRVRREDRPTDAGAAQLDGEFRQTRFANASEEAQADETWTRLLELCPAEHRPVLQLRREGLLLDEIARRTGLHEGSVRRILRKLARELAVRADPALAGLAGTIE